MFSLKNHDHRDLGSVGKALTGARGAANVVHMVPTIYAKQLNPYSDRVWVNVLSAHLLSLCMSILEMVPSWHAFGFGDTVNLFAVAVEKDIVGISGADALSRCE